MRTISLFSGAGGKDLGFLKAGFNIIWANDFDKYAVESYKGYIGDHILLGDITKIKSENIPDDIDLVLGGFPCQGFSIANTSRTMNDQRNFLYKEMLRIVKDKQPKFFVAENVKGLVGMEGGKIIKMIVKDFEKIGYKVDYKVLNSADYGVPQNRERVIIIGNNLGIKNIFPKKTHGKGKGLKPYVTVENVIGYLSNVDLSILPIKYNGEIILNHDASTNVSKTFMGRKYKTDQAKICDYLKKWKLKSNWTIPKIDKHFGYRHTAGHWFRKDNKSGSIPKPSDWWELKKLLGFDNKFDELVTSFEEKEIVFEQSLRVNNWKTPSDTITATGPEIHPNMKRRLSVRECAIIQTFPNDYNFVGGKSTQYRQIGNAVPVEFAYAIAKEIKKYI